jgi:PIN domain nuclease of toxin-antitoxin system
MKILLDTHIWIWRLLEPERLSARLANLLADPAHELLLSPISVWEALVLARRGRLELHPDPSAWVRTALRRSATVMAPFDHEVALRSEELLGFGSQDPADRFLVATAMVHGLALATADQAMLEFEPVKTVPEAVLPT